MTLEITARAKKMKASGVRVVSFASGEPDFDTPDYITEAAHRALDLGITKYTPAAGTVELREAICNKLRADNGLNYDPSQIVVSNGAKHSLFNAFMATLDVGDEAIVPAPYWLSYPELVKMAGGTPVFVPTRAENGFKLTPSELERAITPKTKALVLNSPNNPTGAVYSRDELDALAAVIERRPMYVISDEIYEKLIYDGEHCSIAACSDALKQLTVVVNGMSKTYAMTGWRIGYAAANKTLASAMSSMQSHATSNANSIAQYASVAALADVTRADGFLRRMHGVFAARKQLAVDILDGLGVEYIRPQGAFYVMVSVKKYMGMSVDGNVIRSAADFAGALLDTAKVAVIPCEGFGAPDYIRLSYAASESDIKSGLDAFGEFLTRIH